jgi:AraC family transcriptional regulator
MAELNPLHSGARVTISDYRCLCGKGGPDKVEYSPTSDIVFVRRGVFRRHIDFQEEIADPNHVIFFQEGQEYRISHPAESGDDCTVLSFGPEIAGEALSEWAVGQKLSETRPFSESSRCASPKLILGHWKLLRLITHHATPIEIEEAACDVIGLALSEGFVPKETAVRDSTRRAHRELVDQVKLVLNANPASMPTLEGLATALGTSPFHLCRVFKEQTGVGLADYAVRLRVHLAVGRLVRTKSNVGSIAATLGFSSLSYFVFRFHQVTGLTPRQYRASASLMSSRTAKI